MLSPTETQMPFPDTSLPSKRRSTTSAQPYKHWRNLGTRLTKARIPHFDVVWPVDDPTVQSNGLTGFFHDFYHITVQRPYQNAPEFDFIRVLVNSKGITSKLSQPKCLIVCSSRSCQENFFQALLWVRVKKCVRVPHSWTPLHRLMDCLSVIYQVMFQQMQVFVEDRLLLLLLLLLLQKMDRQRPTSKITPKLNSNRNFTAGFIHIGANSNISTISKIRQRNAEASWFLHRKTLKNG